MPKSFKKIISIHGAPRSGTSWLGQIFDSSPEVRYKFQPLFSYSFKDRINISSSKSEIMQYFEELYNYPQDNFLDQLDKKKNHRYPIFKDKKKTPEYLVTKMVRYHFLIPRFSELLDNIFIIAIIRNPCAVLNSWRKAPREFITQWDFMKEWYFGQSKNNFRPEEYYGYNKWKESTKLFIEMEKHYPSLCKTVKYEELVKNPKITTEDIFKFVDLKITNDTLEFINLSTSYSQDDPYSVFKGKKDIHEWKNELDIRIIRQIYGESQGTEFEQFLI